VVANQRLQCVAASGGSGKFATQLIGSRAQRIFLGATGLQSFAQRRNLALQPLERLRSGREAQFCFSALRAQIFKLVPRPGPSRFPAAPPRAPGCQALFALAVWLRALLASVNRCMAWRRLASSSLSAAKTSSAAVRAFLLARLHLLRKARASSAAVSRNDFCCVRSSGNPPQLRPRLLQLGAGRGNARLQLGHALSIGAFPRRGPLQLDSRWCWRDSAPPGPRHPTGSPAR